MSRHNFSNTGWQNNNNPGYNHSEEYGFDQAENSQQSQDYSRGSRFSPNVQPELVRENERLQTILQEVQSERLSALDDFQPRSDADLRDEVFKLQYQVTGLSRYIRSNLANSDETRAALRGQTLTEGAIDEIGAIYFFESVLWKQLVEQLFKDPFQPFGRPHSDTIRETWCIIFGDGPDGIPIPSEASEKWKSITTNHLFDKVTPWDRQTQIDNNYQSIINRLWNLDRSIYNILSRDGQLKKMVETAWDLATTFSRQRCQLQLIVSEHIGGIDDERVDVLENIQHWPAFVFAVSPALLKDGNGYGQDFGEQLCLIKSKVVRGV